LSKEEEEQVKGIFEKAINNTNMTVAVESLSPSELPVIVTMSEWMRRMKDMARTGGGGYAFMGNMPDSYNVAINANHGIVKNKACQAGVRFSVAFTEFA
jgi:molecular chaperone HtpG